MAPQDGGPIEKITGIQGKAESAAPPNNNPPWRGCRRSSGNGYERTLRWTKISQALAALTPFAVKDAARKAGFDTSRSFEFKPFAPKLPEELGEFHSFLG